MADTYKLGDGLKLIDTIEGKSLVVDSTNEAEKDNKRPITSHGVAIEVGNVAALLATI